ncbi:MAG: hypothetical protein ACE14P_10595 [Methanotrichaceae archaeon]
MMRLLVMCGLFLMALSLDCTAVESVKIGGNHTQDALSLIAFNPFARNFQDSSDLWRWGSSPIGHGQLLQDQGPATIFGGWIPFGETSLSYTKNETPLGYTINESKQISSGQGQTWITGDFPLGDVNPYDDASDKPSRLFSSQGFFSGYGDWEPAI